MYLSDCEGGTIHTHQKFYDSRFRICFLITLIFICGLWKNGFDLLGQSNGAGTTFLILIMQICIIKIGVTMSLIIETTVNW